MQIFVNHMFHAQLCPLLFTAIYDNHNKHFLDAYQWSGLLRLNDGDNFIPYCYDFFPKMTISLTNHASK